MVESTCVSRELTFFIYQRRRQFGIGHCQYHCRWRDRVINPYLKEKLIPGLPNSHRNTEAPAPVGAEIRRQGFLSATSLKSNPIPSAAVGRPQTCVW